MKHADITLSGTEARPAIGRAHLTNMALAYRTLADCMEQHPSSSTRLGVLYGPSGYGKSVAAAFTAARFDAGYVEAKSIWTQRSLLNALAEAVGIVKVEKTGPRIFEQLVDHLNTHPRPLIIDEMDYLVKKMMVDLIRDILDATPIAILMIGMEALPAKLKEWEQFDNRILVHTAAQPASDDDALALRDCYRRKGVMVADDLALEFRRSCAGVTRRIVTNLERAQTFAIDQGQMTIDLAWWGDRRIENGTLPVRRPARGMR